MTGTDLSNVDLVRSYVERLAAQDLDSARKLWTDATVERFPDRTCHGTDEIAAYFSDLYRAVDDFDVEAISIGGSGDDVYACWRMTGRHVGPVLGVAGTNRPIAVDGVDHLVVRDGVIVSNFVIFDQMQFARQVGLLPADESIADRALKAAFNAKTKAADAVRKRRR
jgi:ketosteroid isomerase-like protein